ncbi:TPA: aminoacyltransferase [Streptococcus suis]
MHLTELTLTDYQAHAKQVSQRSFMQTEEMAELLSKRGMTVRFIGLVHESTVLVSAILYTISMTGGLHMEINSGPVYQDEAYLSDFYRLLKDYAKQHGALELIVKPYEIYQLFDSNGQPTSKEQTHLIDNLTQNGYHFDGLQTGYPGGEPDWHYVKDLNGLNPENLVSSFSKKGKTLMKKTHSMGMTVRVLQRDELAQFKAITSATSERREYLDKSLEYYQDFYDSFGDKAEFTIASIHFPSYLKRLSENQAKLKETLSHIEADLKINPKSRKKQNEHREISSQIDSFEQRKQEAQTWIDQYGQEDIALAASLFIYTDHELVYLFSGSLTEFNNFYAPVLLQEYAMHQAIKRGISFYNLLGITGNFDGSDGVLRFKQNFGGFIARRMGTFRYYPNPLKYKVIQLIKKLVGR